MYAVLHSKNSKVGDVAATYAPISKTCPASCPLRDNGCYAQGGNVGFKVRRTEEYSDGLNGDTVATLEGDEIADLATYAPLGHALRIHVSGDATSDFRASQMARGARSWPGRVWSYTHAWRDVQRDSWGKVSILASCETVADVVRANRRGYASALVVAEHPKDGRAFTTADGVKVIPCPAQTRDVKCTDCRLCWNDKLLLSQAACISFAAHGATKKRTLKVLNSQEVSYV
jgi:hypothetical protein